MTDVSAGFRSRRPNLRLTLSEAAAFVSPRARPDLGELTRGAPRGDGHTVLVLPALCHGDSYTRRVRDFLAGLGYDAAGWNLGVNAGPTGRILEGVGERFSALADRRGPVSLLGYSLGGLLARWLAQRMPERVRQVITVCSPIREPMRNFWLPLEPFRRAWGTDVRRLAAEIAGPLAVPCTVLFSRQDGIVNWRACLDPACPDDCIEISGQHALIERNPEVMRIVAARLARPAATPHR